MKQEVGDHDAAKSLTGQYPRCICCNGFIEMSLDEDISLGLNLKLGLVSDECALICDGCAARLAAARAAETTPARKRR